jgi:glycosyltransferase involved in cell wall biosynthesis
VPLSTDSGKPRLLFLVTEDWYFWSHRLPIARAARSAGYDVIVACRITNHGARIADEGFRVHPLNWRRRGFNPIREICAIIDIARIYRRENPSIVHHIALKSVVYGSIAARLSRVSSVINSINGLGFAFTANSPWAWIARLALRLVFRMVVDRPGWTALFQNDDDRQVLTQQGFMRHSAIAVVRGSGVDVAHFAALPTPSSEPPVIAVVTRMLMIKGVETLVAASRLLRQDGVPHYLQLVGDPDPDNAASIPSELLQAWSNEPGISWLGYQHDVRSIWAQAHIAALTSLGGEGIPKSLLEAAACARPIISTNVPGCRDIARDGINAILVPPDNPEALAFALKRLIEEAELRHQYGIESRRIAQTEYSDSKIAEQVLALYQSLLHQRPNPTEQK